MRGVRVAREGGLMELFGGEGVRIAALHWLLNLQSGPFRYDDQLDGDAIEADLQRYWVDLAECASTSHTLWRAGVFPRFAHLLVEDEWSYLVGLPGDEEAAISGARRLIGVRILSGGFFELLGALDALFLIKVGHLWWEAYGLSAEATASLQGYEPTDSSHWLQRP